MQEIEETVKETAVAKDGAGKIIWQDKEMKSTYSNVCNVAKNNDEIMLLFGTSEAWNEVQREVVVNLTNRIIMTPATAKRLQEILNRMFEQ